MKSRLRVAGKVQFRHLPAVDHQGLNDPPHEHDLLHIVEKAGVEPICPEQVRRGAGGQNAHHPGIAAYCFRQKSGGIAVCAGVPAGGGRRSSAEGLPGSPAIGGNIVATKILENRQQAGVHLLDRAVAEGAGDAQDADIRGTQQIQQGQPVVDIPPGKPHGDVAVVDQIDHEGSPDRRSPDPA